MGKLSGKPVTPLYLKCSMTQLIEIAIRSIFASVRIIYTFCSSFTLPMSLFILQIEKSLWRERERMCYKESV